MLRSKKTHTTNAAPAPAASPTAAPTTAPASDTAAAAAASAPPPTTPALSAGEIESFKAHAAEAAQWKDKCLRSLADLDNYRKRAAREKLEHSKFATQQMLTRLLPVIDNFELALQHADQAGDSPAAKSLIDGLKMTLGQLHGLLREAGVEVVNAEGQRFDPQFHEAVSHLESDTHESGKVIQQLRKGYRLHERLLRPATVVVSKGKPQPPAEPAAPAEAPAPTAGDKPAAV